MSESPPLQRLREFLVGSLSEGELRRMLGDLYGPRLVRMLPSGGPIVYICEEAVLLLERQGLVHDELFAELTRLLPAKRGQIEQLAEAWRHGSTLLPEDPRPTTIRIYEGYVYAIIELATTARARRAVMLQEGSCECGVGLLGLPGSGGTLEVVARDCAVTLSAQDADVFARLRGPYILRDHDKILLGDTLAEVRLAPGHPVIKLQVGPQQGLMVPLSGSVRLGRAAPLERLPQDLRMSRWHAQIDPLYGDVVPGAANGPTFMLIDVGSANGTWVRIRERHKFGHGDEFRAFDGTFRVEVTLRR